MALPPCFGLDIGGSLCKISYFEPIGHSGENAEEKLFRERMRELISSPEPYGQTGKRDIELEFCDDMLGGKVYLMRFESRKMESFLKMAKESNVVNSGTPVCCTGGGSRKFASLFLDTLGVRIQKADELGCLVDGINFTLQRGMQELYRVDHETFL